MKAYLNNGITIEGTVAEIKRVFGRTALYNYNYSKYYSCLVYPSQPLDPKYNKFEITCSTTDINNKTISSWNKKN